MLLDELLTRTTPFDAQELLKCGFDEMRRVIRETEPEKPSTRLATRKQGRKWESEKGSREAGAVPESPRPTFSPAPFRFPPWARAQIISPETGREVAEGEPGLIRIFDLANVRSVMAIQTEDLGVRRSGGFEFIGRASHAEPRGCSLMSLTALPHTAQ